MTAFKKRLWIAVTLCCLCTGAVLVCCFRDLLHHFFADLYKIISDKEISKIFLMGLGWWAPLGYIAVQVLQVIIAPVPGEATGFVGGYLFGTVGGFIYSTIALTFGSYVNFLIGRFLGKRWLRRLFSDATLSRMDFLLNHQGAIVVFFLFLLPGFPKDSLCLFLGLSALPMKVLVLLSAVGRMPGTLLLSAQGASLFEGDYMLLAVLTGACLIMAFLAWWFRELLYRWIEKQKRIER